MYKLTIKDNPAIVQGLISVTIKEDNIYLDLIESAPFNLGKKKMYVGVPGNLVAFICKLSFEKGFNGYVSFTAKTRLMAHYINLLNAKPIGNNRMIIDEFAATILVNKYFPKT